MTATAEDLAYQALLARIRSTTSSRIVRVFGNLTAYDERDVDGFLERAVPIVERGQAEAVRATDAYMARAIGAEVVGLDVVDLTGPAVRAGTELEVVYRRPFVTLWSGLAKGREFAEALGAATARLESTAETDVALSTRAAAVEYARAEPKVTGFRRVTDGRACTLCAIASTQRYGREELMPIHARCGCTVRPLGRGDRDAMREVMRELKFDPRYDDLLQSQAASRARKAASLAEERRAETKAELERESDPDRRERLAARERDWARRESRAKAKADHEQRKLEEFRGEHGTNVRTVEIHEHGELGPVLGDSSHSFTGPRDI
jgi:hypothetical protein